MPRVVLTPVQVTRDGVATPAEVSGDPVNGHVVRNTGRTIITVRNADASNPHTITFVLPGQVYGKNIEDHQVSIPASSSREFGAFPVDGFGANLAINVDSAELKLTAREP